MGSSLPPPAACDLVESIARRRGAMVELRLAKAEAATGTGPFVLELTKGRRSLEAAADVVPAGAGVAGGDIVVSVPASSLSDGIWQLGLKQGKDGDLADVDARLLIQGRRPVVLLWGHDGLKSRLPSRGGKPALVRRVAQQGSRVLDVGLRALPEGPADTVRSTLHKVARTVVR